MWLESLAAQTLRRATYPSLEGKHQGRVLSWAMSLQHTGGHTFTLTPSPVSRTSGCGGAGTAILCKQHICNMPMSCCSGGLHFKCSERVQAVDDQGGNQLMCMCRSVGPAHHSNTVYAMCDVGVIVSYRPTSLHMGSSDVGWHSSGCVTGTLSGEPLTWVHAWCVPCHG